MNVNVYNDAMRVFSDAGIVVYVYAEVGGKHHMPHCHVHWKDARTVVAIPSLEVIVGRKLSKRVHITLKDHLEEIAAAWKELNAGDKR